MYAIVRTYTSPASEPEEVLPDSVISPFESYEAAAMYGREHQLDAEYGYSYHVVPCSNPKTNRK